MNRFLIIYINLFFGIQSINTLSLSLNGNDWLASNQNNSIRVSAQVPGSIYTDLLRGNILKQDPLIGNNDINYRWVSYDNWTYHKYFYVENSLIEKKAVFLVCHGLDTAATLYINQRLIGSTNNMFIRYKFDVKPYIRSGQNEIRISFESAISYAKRAHDQYIGSRYLVPPESMPFAQKGELHVNFIRKMQASFSWDWGPSFATQGIWKDIQIEAFDSAIIRDITVDTFMSDNNVVNHSNHSNHWTLNVTLYLESAHKSPFEGLLQISVYNTIIFRKLIVFIPSFDGNIRHNLIVGINRSIIIHKWYPNGIGSQMLYDLNFILTTTEEDFRKTLRIGFRTIELVQDPIKPEGLTFYFKVNGVPFYAKGSNWIPAHLFQEELTSDYIRHLLESCKAADMNMLRVWGGGVYESDLFYQIADELGILIWQDFMFACALYPSDQNFLDSVKEEVSQQTRRLQSHPSIAVWAGNNENEAAIAQMWWPEIFVNEKIYKKDYITLYVKTIEEKVFENDISRPYLTSSPSNGIETIKEGYLSNYPQDNRFGDVHFYYYGTNAWDWRTYPSTRFASEYGFQSFPSLKSLSKVMNSSDLTFPLSDGLSERQHRTNGNNEIINLIDKYMNLPISGGANRLDDFIYLSQISQAMSLKIETEFYRRNRAVNPHNGEGFTMGALYWQLNDIWVAPTWSSIEFGGKWKMCFYFIKEIFKPLLIVAFEEENKLKVALIRDDYDGNTDFTITVMVRKWSQMEPSFQTNVNVFTNSISSEIVFQQMISNILFSGDCLNRKECFIEVSAKNNANNMRSNNFLLLTPIRDSIGIINSNVSLTRMTGPHNFMPDYVYDLTIETNNIALFVWLDFGLDSDIVGHFSQNGFLMSSKTKTINFYSKTPFNANYLKSYLTLKTLTDVKTN